MWVYILFFAGFIILIKGADYLVEGASSIAKRFGLSPLFIGLTIVAFGTSAPELFVNLIASIKGSAGIAIGNIVGSNIANILLILGIAAAIYPLKVKDSTVRKEIPLSFLAALALLVAINDHLVDGLSFNILTRSDGLMLIFFFIIFLYYAFGIMISGSDDEVTVKERSQFLSWAMVAGGLAALVLGGKWIVDNGLIIAQVLNISDALVGLTIVAIGTSLPELATSAVAAYKHKPDIAIGNVVGSNIFNIFWILGISSIIKPIEFAPALNFDVIAAVVATLLLLAALFIGEKKVLQKWQGYFFIMLYIAYIVFLIYRG
ncbi:MAG: calcium/sodium antiporter [Patescibacteria group bacterium]|jgi:cation:H+ antiporter